MFGRDGCRAGGGRWGRRGGGGGSRYTVEKNSRDGSVEALADVRREQGCVTKHTSVSLRNPRLHSTVLQKKGKKCRLSTGKSGMS